MAGLGLEKAGTGVSLCSPHWLQQNAIPGSKSLCIRFSWLGRRKDAWVRQRELGVTVAMVADFAETIASWRSRRKGLGKWVAGDPGAADTGQGRPVLLFLFCFLLLLPTLGIPRGGGWRRLLLVPSISLNSSLAECLRHSILPSILL